MNFSSQSECSSITLSIIIKRNINRTHTEGIRDNGQQKQAVKGKIVSVIQCHFTLNLLQECPI